MTMRTLPVSPCLKIDKLGVLSLYDIRPQNNVSEVVFCLIDPLFLMSICYVKQTGK